MVVDSDFGHDHRKISALGLFDFFSVDFKKKQVQINPWRDEAYRIQGGTHKIIEALSRKYKKVIRRRHQLLGVESSDAKRFKLIFATPGGEKTLWADHVVFAIPPPALSKVPIRVPGYWQRVRQKLGKARYGANTKVVLLFRKRVWDSFKYHAEGLSDLGFWFWDSSEGQNTKWGSLTLYFKTDKKATTQLHQTIKKFLNQVSQVFPKIKEEFLGYRAFSWPFSYPGVYFPMEETTRASEISQNPIGHLYLVGSFFGGMDQSYMEGAVKSAHRVARKIQRKVKGKSRVPGAVWRGRSE